MAKYTIKPGDTKASLKNKFGIALNDKRYRSTDPNKLFAGEVIDIPDAASPLPITVAAPQPKPLPITVAAPKITAPSAPSPILKEGVDLSMINPDVKPFNEQNAQTVAVVDSRDNPDGTTTNFLSNGQTDTGKYTRNPDGTLTFVPANTPGAQSFRDVVPQTDASPATDLLRTSKTIQDEIAAIEKRMMERDANRSNDLEDAGVFDDMKTLNSLKAELRTAQDRNIEIPIEARQMLRGNQATKAEYNAEIGPKLEANTLRTLAASRNVAALTDAINTNISIIDTRIQAETKRDEFLYTQKKDRLQKIETVYGNIITEEQKAALEAKKFQYDLMLENVKSENSLRNDLLKDLAKRGVGGNQIQSYMNATTDELLAAQSQISSPKRWSEMTYEEAAMVLDKESFNKFEAYKEWEKTASEEQKAAVSEGLAVADSAHNTVKLIEEMLNDKAGLKTSVGYGLGRVDFNLFGAGVESGQFRAKAKQLLSQETLNKLLQLKAAGGTLGAISEKELDILSNAATALGAQYDENGKATGKFMFKEDDFLEALKTMRIASMKTYIAASIGKEKYSAAGYQNAEYDTIEKRYKDLLENGSSTTTNYYEQDQAGSVAPTSGVSTPGINAALEVIKQNEGLRTEAYLDSAGVPTIGFGTTTIGGRPVQLGDRLSTTQAQDILRQQIVKNYTNFADRINSNLTPNQFAALTSFEYNLGPGVWNQPTGRQILSLIEAGRYNDAGQLMLQYNKAKDPQTGQLKPIAGLTNRRMREANLLLS